jgi:DNA adenine methylase
MHEKMTMTESTDTWCAPLLRWAGSKRTLLPRLVAHFQGFGQPECRYIEPFAGSACLFFALHPRAALIADLNEDLISTYRVIRDHPRLVHRTLCSWGADRASYYTIRSLDPADLDSIERAGRFLYLNRLCFNGVYRTNRAGQFNVPYGVRPGAFPTEAHVYRCSVALRSAVLECGDFESTTADVTPSDFVYLDPPYTQDSSRAYGVYGYGSFDNSELDRILRTLKRIDEIGATFLFSYADVREAVAIFPPEWFMQRVVVTGHVAARPAARGRRSEILLSNRPFALA